MAVRGYVELVLVQPVGTGAESDMSNLRGAAISGRVRTRRTGSMSFSKIQMLLFLNFYTPGPDGNCDVYP